MPMFEYKCEECGLTQDKIRDYENRDHPVLCEACGKFSCKRVEVAKSNFHLKGGGWHDPQGGVR